MSIFKKKEKKVIEKLSEPDIQIMMLGGRRVGKTSMIASMYNSFDSVTAGTNLQISKKGGKAIDESLDHMISLFKRTHMLNEEVPGVSDFMQTQGFDKIDFMLSISGKKTVKPKVVRFVDCSGEWLNNREKEEELGEQIEKSEVVIIAIDSVLLMEENGKYSTSQNAVQTVTEFIINNMNPDNVINSKKMILFVPMKCEKYYHQNEDKGSSFYHKRMQTLIDKIQEEYKQLFNFLTKPNNKKCFTVGILPVITLGGVEFDEFTSNNKNNILTDEIRFTYCEPNEFEPKFCDRPLIYSLLFTQKKIADDYYAKAYNANKGNKKISAVFGEWLQDRKNYTKEVDYIHELDCIKENLSTIDYPGFAMIQDPEILELKVENMKKG